MNSESNSEPALNAPQAGQGALPGEPPATSTAPAAPPPARRSGSRAGLLAAWLLAIIAIAVSALLWQKVDGMQRQLARQSAEANSQSVEARALARQAGETVRDTAAKVAVLDSKVSDLNAYRAQLEDLVRSVARVHDENLAVELESALRVAQEQTQLTGSVEPLLAALRTAERRLAHSADPRLTPVARAVARDLERVKAASVPDVAGLLARIDQVLRQADELPLANAVAGGAAGRPGRGPASDGRDATAAQPAPQSWWGRWWRSFQAEAGGLLRVSRVERPEALLLSPEQGFLVRENFKLRLQSARLALLARQYEAARADLAAAHTALGDWFDPASRRTRAAAALLQQVQGLTRDADLPRAQDTLAALDAATAGAPASGR